MEGRKGDLDGVSRPLHFVLPLPRLRLPDVHHPVQSPAGEERTVAAEAERGHGIRVTWEKKGGMRNLLRTFLSKDPNCGWHSVPSLPDTFAPFTFHSPTSFLTFQFLCFLFCPDSPQERAVIPPPCGHHSDTLRTTGHGIHRGCHTKPQQSGT